MLKVIACSLALILMCVASEAMPPHPQILELIKSGQVVAPPFMADPNYARQTGINAGLDQPLFQPGMRLVNWNTLVVLARFTDQAGATPAVFFDSLAFSQGSGSYGPSLRGFYNRASYGNLTLVTVNFPSSIGWVSLPQNRRYYTAAGGTYSYGMGTYPNNSQKLCEDIIGLIDPVVNFANYDNDADGFVDGIIIVHSGRGAETSGDTLDIWSHKWQITPQYRDGVQIMNYCVDPEYRYVASPNDGTVGVFAHEFGHILGLPDLYDYDVPFDSYGLGYWSLMAYGGWNGAKNPTDTLSGVSPAFLDAWSRVKLGFVIPTDVLCPMPGTWIHAVEDSAEVYRLWTYGNYSGPEYFLVEHRYQLYTDTALAGWGLLIYHVDDSQPNNDNEWVPGSPPTPHYKVALEQADNAYHLEYGTNGMGWEDVFRAGWVDHFDSASGPSSRDYYGNISHVRIWNISVIGYSMLADLDVGSTAAPSTPTMIWPLNLSAHPGPSVYFSWSFVPCGTKFHLQLAFDQLFQNPIYQDSTLTTNYAYVNLQPYGDALFWWRVRAGNSVGWSAWSSPWQFLIDHRPPYNCRASSPDTAYSSSFLVTWTAGQDSVPSSGLCYYNIWCNDGGGWDLWLYNVDTLSAMFTGASSGSTYYFEAVAFDCANNMEQWLLIPECTTYVDISCFQYLPGDANMYVGAWPAQAIGADITYIVNYLRVSPTSVPCLLDGVWASADVNGSCDVSGSDVIRFVNYLRGAIGFTWCPGYDPCWPTPPDLPDNPPGDWPNCGTAISSQDNRLLPASDR